MRNVSSPGVGASNASQMERAPGALRSLWPACSERRWSSNSAGSADQTRDEGSMALTARAVPATSPPPLQHTTTSSGAMPSSVACSTISSPTVPCPAMTCGSSKEGTSTAPRSLARLAAISSRLSRSRSYSTTDAPRARVFRIFTRGRPTASRSWPECRAVGPRRRPLARGCPTRRRPRRPGAAPRRAVRAGCTRRET